ERTEREHVAVREIDELDDPVDHRVAESDQRVDAAVGDGEGEDLQEVARPLLRDADAEQDHERRDADDEGEVQDAADGAAPQLIAASLDRLSDCPQFPRPLRRKGRGRSRAPYLFVACCSCLSCPLRTASRSSSRFLCTDRTPSWPMWGRRCCRSCMCPS